ncbi:hypothetical protein [Paenibacillus agricola]|uniref:DUF4276 family protein n=1 Tax=Paenibacillus agricola TaxID=2716264 RepID=A0ABX0JKE4_9BACL|nr:hypothetical protein [Paenibacillus agricola]NHN35622.1 hypothetical protein [Paenibacillus agricola]
MATKRKKVLFVIVEGESDGHLFYEELARKYTKELVVIRAYKGDIFTDLDQRGVEIRERIRQFFLKRMGELRLNDFLGILHFSDTDGAFVTDDKIQVDPNQDRNVLYKVNGIFVNSIEQQEKMQFRNKVKKDNTHVVRFIDSISYNKVKIPYRLFYLSQHLEHVVFDELNVLLHEKQKKIITFLKTVGTQPTVHNLLISQLPPLPANVLNKHVESWKFIDHGDHSLQRYTNAILMYEFIDQLLIK